MDITCYSGNCPEGGSSANRFVARCCYSALREHQQMQTLAFRQRVWQQGDQANTWGKHVYRTDRIRREWPAQYAHIRTGTGAAERQWFVQISRWYLKWPSPTAMQSIVTRWNYFLYTFALLKTDSGDVFRRNWSATLPHTATLQLTFTKSFMITLDCWQQTNVYNTICYCATQKLIVDRGTIFSWYSLLGWVMRPRKSAPNWRVAWRTTSQ